MSVGQPSPLFVSLRFMALTLVIILPAKNAWADLSIANGLGGLNLSADNVVKSDQITPVVTLQPISKEEPIVFTADHVDYNDKDQTVTLTGNVELTQNAKDGNGAQTVKADRIEYNQAKNEVVADGHIAMIQPSGDVVFAEHAELTGDLANAFARKVGALLSDNSRMAGRVAERRDGRYMDIAQGVYSPCDLCASDPSRPPLWQIKADRINHDMEAHDLTYENAWMEFMGVPVFYVPYLSTPDPSVKRRSGFLTPTLGLNTIVGDSLRTPYYYDLAPDKDVIITPTFSTEDKLQLATEWRQRFTNGKIDLTASGTVADLTEDDGTVKQDRFRGHFKGETLFDLNDTWRTGTDINLSTDKTYLQRYHYSSPDILTNRGYVEGFDQRDYAAAEMFYFQDTRPGFRPQEPYVIPRLQAEKVSAPDSTPLGGRYTVTGGLLALERPEDNLDTRRFSTSVDWQRVDVAPVGLVSTAALSTRADGYLANNFTNPATGSTANSTSAGRIFPYAQETISYPLARQFGSVQQTLEPIISLLAAPTLNDDNRFPNEDSLDFELDDTNLFRANRFTGIDRQEGGSRVTYGLKTGLYGFGGGSTTLFVGQSYRFNRDNSFADGSGLEDQASDYVGRLIVDPAPWLYADYGFRADHDSLQVRKHDANFAVGDRPFRLQANYLYIDRTAGTTTDSSREELNTAATVYLNDQWTVTGAQTRSFAPDNRPLLTSLTLGYTDECFNFAIIGERNYTTRNDVESGDTIYIRLLFKNLGGIDTPAGAGDVFDSDALGSNKR